MQPMDKSSLQIQLLQQEIVRTDVEIKKGISEIRDSRGISQLQLNQLTRTVKDRMRQAEEVLQRFETAGSELKKPSDKESMMVQVGKFRGEIDMNLQHLRRVTLDAIRRIDEEARESLLSGEAGALGGARQRVSAAAQMRDQSSQATESLSDLVSRMSSEVERSGETLNTLVRCSDTLTSTETELGSMGGTIQSSGRLLSKYSRRELTDKILITLASCLFFATVFYIVQKRLFPRGFSFW